MEKKCKCNEVAVVILYDHDGKVVEYLCEKCATKWVSTQKDQFTGGDNVVR